MTQVTLVRLNAGRPKVVNPALETARLDTGFQVGGSDASGGATYMSIIPKTGESDSQVMLDISNGAFQFKKDGSASLGVSGKTITFQGAIQVEGTHTIVGGTTFRGDVDLGDDAADTITFVGIVDSNITPDGAGTRSLGSATAEWKDIFIATGATAIKMGSGQEASVGYDAGTGLNLTSDHSVQVNLGDDAGTYAFKVFDSTPGVALFSVNSLGVAAFSGTVGVAGDFDVNTDKFTVAAATGNVGIGGTLTTGDDKAVTFGDTVLTSTSASSAMVVTGDAWVFSNTSGIALADNLGIAFGNIGGAPDMAVSSDGTDGYISATNVLNLIANGGNLVLDASGDSVIAEDVYITDNQIGVSGDLDLMTLTSGTLTVAGNVVASTDGYVSSGLLRLTEQSSAPSHVANTGLVYSKEIGGLTELFYRDSNGTDTGQEIQLTSNGSINVGSISFSLDDAYNDGSTVTVDNTDVLWDMSVNSATAFKVQGSGGNFIVCSNATGANTLLLGGASVPVAFVSAIGGADTVQLASNANRSLMVMGSGGESAGKSFTLAAGAANPVASGDFNGGDLILNAGAKVNGGTNGAVKLGNASTSVVKVEAALQVTAGLTQTTGIFSVASAIAGGGITITGQDFGINTVSSGTLTLGSAGLMDVNASGGFDLDVTGGNSISLNTVGAGGNVSIGADGGTVTLTGANGINLSVSGSNELDITAGVLDVNVQSFTLDGTSASSVTVTGANLTLSTATSGTVELSGADGINVNSALEHKGNVTFDAQTRTLNGIEVRDLPSATTAYTNNTGGEIAQYTVVAATTTGGEIIKADNSAAASARVLGLAAASIADAASGRVWVRDGEAITNGAWAWTIGTPVYLGTAGGLTQTAPTAADSVVYQVGIATSATTMQVQLQFILEN